ncbi:hypothetical protein AUP68_07957 [Ilyonectria robusta]
MSLKQNLAVKIVAGYAAFGLVLMEILYLGVWCRPFTEYWAVPPDSGMLEPSLEGFPPVDNVTNFGFPSSMLRCHEPSHH